MKRLIYHLLLLILIVPTEVIAQNWVQKGVDIDGEVVGESSGTSASIDGQGEVVAIGSPQTRQVKIYDWDGNNWNQKGSDIDAPNSLYTYFGWSVDLSQDGNIVAVGSPGNSTVIIYKWSAGSWNQLGQEIELNGGSYSFTLSLSLSSNGKTIAIGTPEYQNGSVKVYALNSFNVWSQKGSVITGANAGDLFGWSTNISSDGNTIITGAIGNSGESGYVQVFEFTSDWTQKGYTFNGINNGNQLGWSVDVAADGRFIAMGAPYYSANAGRVKVYRWAGSYWSIIGDIQGENGSQNVGASVSLNSEGSVMAIGQTGSSDEYGRVKVYDYGSGTWTQLAQDIDGENPGDFTSAKYPVDLSDDGETVVIGSANNYPTSQLGLAGHARVYNLDRTDPCTGFEASFEQFGLQFVNTTSTENNTSETDSCCTMGFQSVKWTIREILNSGPEGPIITTTTIAYGYNYTYVPTPNAIRFKICMEVISCSGCVDEVCQDWGEIPPSRPTDDSDDTRYKKDNNSNDDEDILDSKTKFLIYPNPNDGNFEIHFDNLQIDEQSELYITNSMGKKVIDITDINNQVIVNMQDLASGVYIVVFKNGTNIKTQKFILEK